MEPESNYRDDTLEKEARLFARYLIDCDPPKEMIVRYISANRKLGIDKESSLDTNILKFSRAHPWSVPFLDAATGLTRPDALIRKKIYTMAAVLEASTLYTEKFLPRKFSRLSLVRILLTNGILSGVKIMIGVPLFFVVRGRKQ